MSDSGGPGRTLAALYALFALAAGARATVQIATDFGRAPLAYTLSAVAALVYLLIAARIGSAGTRDRRVALAACCFELTGVLVVGTLTVLDPGLFPDQTVWSDFGLGYGLLPLAMPVVGIAWLLRTRASEDELEDGRDPDDHDHPTQHRVRQTLADARPE